MPGQSTEQAQFGGLTAATQVLRETTKWILAIGAGLASVLIAGLRLNQLGHLENDPLILALAIASAVVGIGAVALVVFAAAAVLTNHFATLREIVERGQGAERRVPELPAEVTDALTKSIERERDILYQGIASDLTDLFSQVTEVNAAVLNPRITGIPLTGQVESELGKRAAALNAAAERVVTYAEHWTTTRAWQRLLKVLSGGGIALVVGVVLFTVCVNRPQDATLTVSRPEAVTVFFTGAGRVWAQRTLKCDPEVATLNAVVVGGNLDRPILASPQQGSCIAIEFILDPSMGTAVPRS